MSSIDWSFDLLEELIEDRGDTVIHEKAISCPACRLEDAYASNINIDGQPATLVNGSPGCLSCGGTGWLYRDAKEVLGLITGLKSGSNPTLSPGGFTDPGDCLFSPSLRAGPIMNWDRITIPFPAPTADAQTILRGSATQQENSTLNSGLAENEDRLWYIPACVLWCEDEHGVVYTPGVDFSLIGKTVRWNNPPPINTRYSIKYQGYLEFIVVSAPLTRFDNARSLAPAVYLRKIHVAFMNAHRYETPKKRIDEEVLFTSK